MLRTILITFAVFFAISSGAPAKVTFSTTWFDSAWNAFYVVLFNSLGRIVSHRPGFLGSWLKHHTSIWSNTHNKPKHTNTHEYRRIHTINIQVAYKCARVTNGYIRLLCWNVFLPAFYREWEGIWRNKAKIFCDCTGYNNHTFVFGRPRVCGEQRKKPKQKTKRKNDLICVSDSMLLVCICT